MSETMELVRLEDVNAVQLFTQGGLNAVLDRIEAQVRSVVLDPSTNAGRDEIRSLAFQIARTKTALDAEAKKLTEDWRLATKKVNEERKRSEERLDALKEEIRAPLTAFENKEKNRVAAHEAALTELAGLLVMIEKYPAMSARDLEQHFVEYSDVHAGRDWEEFAERAKRLRSDTSRVLIGKIEARLKYEEEQEELARLREAERIRLQQERDAKIAKEAAERARLDAERKAKAEADAEAKRVMEAAEAERKRVEAEAAKAKAETDRLAREAHEREARMEAQRADLERQKLEADRRTKEAELRAETQAKEAAERERAKIEAERKAAENAQKKRSADAVLRDQVRSFIKADVMNAMAETSEWSVEDQIVDALMAGRIRHVKVIF